MTEGKPELTATKNALPLDNHIQMLGKPRREKGGVGGGCKHLTQHSTSNQQPHLTSPYIKLRNSQSNELKGEERVLYSRII